jgi:RND superfamily putative drug exporter
VGRNAWEATLSGLLERLGRAAARHKWWFVVAWLVAAVTAVALAGGLGGQETNNFRIPGAQSQNAIDLLEKD